MLFQLTYISTINGHYKRDVYRDIAHDAHQYNSSIGATGILLIYNDTIIQILEGNKAEIIKLYAKIKKDTRHKGVLCLNQKNIETREFSNWTMGFKDFNALEGKDYMFSLKPLILKDKIPAQLNLETATLIKTFKKSSGLDIFQNISP